jgi:hypothetical protein
MQDLQSAAQTLFSTPRQVLVAAYSCIRLNIHNMNVQGQLHFSGDLVLGTLRLVVYDLPKKFDGELLDLALPVWMITEVLEFKFNSTLGI